MGDTIRHQTFFFERLSDAGPERVFAAFSDPDQRSGWSAPSLSAAFVYDATDFREGGRDIFRCGSRADPQYTGIATYISIIPNERIVWSEVIDSGGEVLAASLITLLIGNQGAGTRIQMTVQVTSLCGDGMIRGTEAGTEASLNNLMSYLAR